MDEKAKEKIADVIGDIAAAPALAGAKIMETVQKISDRSGGLEDVGADICQAAGKAKEVLGDTAKKISGSEATKKMKNKFEEIGYADKTALLQDAVDKTQMAVREAADKAKDGILEGALKAKESIAELKERSREKCAETAAADVQTDDFFEDAPAAGSEPAAEENAADSTAEPASEKLSLDERAEQAGDSVEKLVEQAAGLADDRAEEMKDKAEDLGEIIAEKADAAADSVKAAFEKLEDAIKNG